MEKPQSSRRLTALSRPTHLDLELLSDYVQKQLAADVAEDVRTHLAVCAECREKLDAVGYTTPGASLPPPGNVSFARDPEPGDTLGEYVVGEQLGRGGMGMVFRARQPVTGRDVAIKVVLREYASSAEALQRVVQEARAITAVRHPNIIDILSMGQLPDGRPYLVMPLLEGVSLHRLLRRQRRLSVVETLEVLAHALAGLEAAHAAGVIHRDLKPDNIFVDTNTSPWTVTLLDFGLAIQLESEQARLTRPGVMMGTPSFMAPEQFRGKPEDATDRLDIYSMGMVAWTMLVGDSPFGEDSTPRLMLRHLTEAVPAPSTRVPEVPEGLDALVLQMLEKDPQQRPNATQALDAARALLRGLPVKGLIPAPATAPRKKSPLALAGMIGGAAMACLAIGLGLGALLREDVSDRPVAPVATKPKPPPEPKVVAAPTPPDPAPVAAAADAGVPVDIPVFDGAERLPCKSIVHVTDVELSEMDQWLVFQIQFDVTKPLTVMSKDERGRGTRALKMLQEDVVACRGGRRQLRVESTLPSGPWLTAVTKTYLGPGLKTQLARLTVVDAPPSPTARSIRCASVKAVGPIEAAATERAEAMAVKVDGEPTLLISSWVPKKGPSRLRKLREAILACRKTTKQLFAAETIEVARWAGKKGTVVSGGVRAELADVVVRAAESKR